PAPRAAARGAALAGRELRQQLPLGRRDRAEGRQAAPPRAGLGRGGIQPVRHRRVPGLLRRAPHRALHLPEHGHRARGGGGGRVECGNSAGNTAWAARRGENGRGEPWRVTYWGLGNEMYGDWQVGAFTAEEYVREATRWARAIRMLDPQAKLVSCGMNGWNEWDRVVIDGMAGLGDYHSLHIYTGSDDYWTNVLQPHQAERAIHYTRALIERAAYRQKIATPPRIAYDEWNVWYRQMTVDLEERYTFADALAVGTYLNIFTR